jgi:hypothetical protein
MVFIVLFSPWPKINAALSLFIHSAWLRIYKGHANPMGKWLPMMLL